MQRLQMTELTLECHHPSESTNEGSSPPPPPPPPPSRPVPTVPVELEGQKEESSPGAKEP